MLHGHYHQVYFLLFLRHLSLILSLEKMIKMHSIVHILNSHSIDLGLSNFPFSYALLKNRTIVLTFINLSSF